jgi:hypothetical protein
MIPEVALRAARPLHPIGHDQPQVGHPDPIRVDYFRVWRTCTQVGQGPKRGKDCSNGAESIDVRSLCATVHVPSHESKRKILAIYKYFIMSIVNRSIFENAPPYDRAAQKYIFIGEMENTKEKRYKEHIKCRAWVSDGFILTMYGNNTIH